jgi:acetyltransferase-like isoleucine patch superfamily enzyme
MPRYVPRPPLDGLPENPYNPHAWIVGEPDIGEGCWIGAFSLIDGSGGLTLGRGVEVSCGAALLTHSSARRCVSERAVPVDRRPTVIEDHVFIGENAVVLMGSRIGHHSIVGAGAVVLEDSVIPPYSLVVGVPARVVRSIEGEIEEWKRRAAPGNLPGPQEEGG